MPLAPSEKADRKQGKWDAILIICVVCGQEHLGFYVFKILQEFQAVTAVHKKQGKIQDKWE